MNFFGSAKILKFLALSKSVLVIVKDKWLLIKEFAIC
jgi:hypothetical protein